jgi:glycine/D-amino acid oxidase-like deaminating enzyme
MAEPLPGQDYYRATAAAADYPAVEGDGEYAICIIGGGFAGLGTAISLAERGQSDVVLLEADTIGHGASGRNGGFVFGGFSLGERSLVGALGEGEARKLYRLTLDAVATIRRRFAQYGIDCDMRDEGVYLANWFGDQRILDRQQSFMAKRLGVEWQRVGRGELAGRLLTERYSGALFERDAFHFHPLKYARGLARALSAAGVRVHERSRALAISADGKGWRVTTPRGELRVREVVLCCGGYLGRLSPRLASAMLPIATYVMVTEPLGERLRGAMRTGAAVYDNRFAFDYYRPLADTRLLWGGRIAVRERAAGEVARLLHADMLKVYPQLAGVKVDYAWSGMMSYGRHKMPQLGLLPDGMWYGMGFGGHGVGPTTLAGDVLAAALCGDGAGLARFAPWKLPPTGGPAGLFAAQLTYWYYALRDRLRE